MHPEDRRRIGDWRWRLTHLYRIRTKKAEKVRFKPNRGQRRIARYFGLWHRLMILKARQVGVSTLFLLWHLDATMFTPNTTTCILAHERSSLKKLFRIVKFAYESCPESIRLADGTVWRKPQAKYDNVNELYFEGLDSNIYVALDGHGLRCLAQARYFLALNHSNSSGQNWCKDARNGSFAASCWVSPE